MDNVVVILGAGKGLGFALAEAFGKAGKFPIIVSKKQKELQEMTAALKQEAIRADYFVADATKPDQTAKMFEFSITKYGIPETFIYNVTDMSLDTLANLDPEKISKLFKANVIGAITATQQCAKLGDEIIHPKNILLTGGGAAIDPVPFAVSLSLTKAALRNYAFSLYDALKERNIYVGLLTIDDIQGLSDAMEPAQVAQVYVDAAHARKDREIIYPDRNIERTDILREILDLTNDPKKLADFLKIHPEIPAFLKENPEVLVKLFAQDTDYSVAIEKNPELKAILKKLL
ncbi:SDR family NAD(P)-dependent oxidoreductase [Enterococcus hirae]|nr:SDR family NAD(P)-dependent oxidoreductase [Enterococcus hirae]